MRGSFYSHRHNITSPEEFWYSCTTQTSSKINFITGHLVIDIDTDDNEGAVRTWSEYSNTDLDSFHDDTSSSSPSCPSSPAPASPSLQAKNLKKLHNKNKPKGKHVLRHASTTSSQGSPYFLPVMTVVKKRIGWLMLLFLAETFTGSVLRMFESELSQVVALSFFVPLLIGTGGNSGSQVQPFTPSYTFSTQQLSYN